jgi:predicted nucleic acid-binding protein
MSLILDASVVVKCLVPEVDSDRSKALLASWSQGQLDVAAPEIISAEVASMLSKRALRGLISHARAINLYQEFVDLGIPLEPIAASMPAALKIALRYGRSVYDSLYVALALEMGWDFVTADEKLYNALRSSLPEVRLLRDWA